MFDRLRKSKLMFWSVELLVIATLIFVSTKISFVFHPIGALFTTMFAPIIISGFLFYCLHPIVTFLEKKGMKKNLAVVVVMLLLVLAVLLMVMSFIPNLIHQITSLAKKAPGFVTLVEQEVDKIANHPVLKNIDIQSYLDKWNLSFTNIMKNALTSFGNGLGSFVSSLAGIIMLIVTVPFILFYMLKDGDKFLPTVSRFFPKEYKDEISELLMQMSKTISKYISGQMIECIFVGVATSIGYLIIGVDYALLFGFIAGLTNLIPYIGPYIGLAPALFVTIFTDPFKAILACVVVLIVQQIDGNIIYPNVIGKSLSIHPLTIIIILLVSGNIAGLLGMLLGVPFYAVCKTIVVYVYNIVQLKDKPKDETTKIEGT